MGDGHRQNVESGLAGKAVKGEGFVLGAGATVVRVGVDGYAAPRGEKTAYFDVLGIHQFDEIFHNDIDAVLVECPVVAEAEEVYLQALTLHHLDVRDIGDLDFRKVGLTGDGAEAGELRTQKLHPVVHVPVLILEGFKDAWVVVLGKRSRFGGEEGEVIFFAVYLFLHTELMGNIYVLSG